MDLPKLWHRPPVSFLQHYGGGNTYADRRWQTEHRNVIGFYTSNYRNDRQYSVLCDGTFVQHLIDHDCYAPRESLIALFLGIKTVAYSSKCIRKELKRNGSKEALEMVRKLPLINCNHKKVMSGHDCIEDLARSNCRHFFVATQDPELITKISEIPGRPLVFGEKGALFIRKPSEPDYQKRYGTEDKEQSGKKPSSGSGFKMRMSLANMDENAKIIDFYKNKYHYGKPSWVLCDGTFIQHLIDHDCYPPRQSLAALFFGVKTFAFSSRCVYKELKRTGSTDALQEIVHWLPMMRCNHKKGMSPRDCVEDLARTKRYCFFIATQDHKLIKKISKIPFRPLIYGDNGELRIKKPLAPEYMKLHESRDDLVQNAEGIESKTVMTLGSCTSGKRKRNYGVADEEKSKQKKAKRTRHAPNP